MTPYGQAGTQLPQPLQTSAWTTTVPNSVRNSAPVGQTSRQAAWVQCLHTSELISQRTPSSPAPPAPAGGRGWAAAGAGCSMKATCRQESALRPPVLSNDMPSRFRPSSGTPFHSLQATSQALQPMQTLVSVKKPIRGGASRQPASGAGSSGPYRLVGPTISGLRLAGTRTGLGRWERCGHDRGAVVRAD